MSKAAITSRFLLHVSAAVGLICAVALQAGANPQRSRKLDFEDKVVEGVNKKPLDSLNATHDGKGGPDRPHLYRKRVGFESKTGETLKELPLLQ